MGLSAALARALKGAPSMNSRIVISLVVCALSSCGGEAQPSSSLPPEYGHECFNTSDCSDAPGTSCIYGYCVSSCAGGASCASGTRCLSALNFACLKVCDAQTTQCGSGMACQAIDDGSSASVCARGSAQSPIGGKCMNDGNCEGSSKCLITADIPDGVCTSLCTQNADCGAKGVCLAAESDGICFAKCTTPGAQSNCRTGFVCSPVRGRSYGACTSN